MLDRSFVRSFAKVKDSVSKRKRGKEIKVELKGKENVEKNEKSLREADRRGAGDLFFFIQ